MLYTTKSVHWTAAASGAATGNKEDHQGTNQEKQGAFYYDHRLKDRGSNCEMVEALCAEQVKSACGFDTMINCIPFYLLASRSNLFAAQRLNLKLDHSMPLLLQP